MSPRNRAKDAPEPLKYGFLTIFVDGSMKRSPRRGGMGIRFVWIAEDGHEADPWDHAPPAILGATNNQMELAAPTEALKLALSPRAPFDLSTFDRIEIRTDSQYVKDGVPLAISVCRATDGRRAGELPFLTSLTGKRF